MGGLKGLKVFTPGARNLPKLSEREVEIIKLKLKNSLPLD